METLAFFYLFFTCRKTLPKNPSHLRARTFVGKNIDEIRARIRPLQEELEAEYLKSIEAAAIRPSEAVL